LALIVTISFLAAGNASADFAIAGEWFENRGPTVNIPPGIFDGPCGAAPFTITKGTRPITAAKQIAAPCARHQVVPDPVGFAQKPQFGVPIPSPFVVAATDDATGVGENFRIPANVFSQSQTSMIGVPFNPVIQQLDTSFNFDGPVTIRVLTANHLNTPSFTPAMPVPGQRVGIASQTRLMQANAWMGAGQTLRTAKNFNHTDFTGISVSRQVSYTGGADTFGGTMGMFLQGGGKVYIKADIVTVFAGIEILTSPLGGGPGNTQHMGRGYLTTQHRIGNTGIIFANYNIETPCTVALPPTPLGCDLVTGLSFPLGAVPGATTVNTGFPWTTGHVSAYARGTQGGQPQTTTLTAVGSDTLAAGVRTIQLVAGGVAFRTPAEGSVGIIRTAHLEIVTIMVPEPGSTMALLGGLGLIGGLYSMRRRFL